MRPGHGSLEKRSADKRRPYIDYIVPAQVPTQTRRSGFCRSCGPGRRAVEPALAFALAHKTQGFIEFAIRGFGGVVSASSRLRNASSGQACRCAAATRASIRSASANRLSTRRTRLGPSSSLPVARAVEPLGESAFLLERCRLGCQQAVEEIAAQIQE